MLFLGLIFAFMMEHFNIINKQFETNRTEFHLKINVNNIEREKSCLEYGIRVLCTRLKSIW